jgi:hypothetical protein
MHPEDQRPVGFEIRKSFGAGILVRHVTKAIVSR